MAQLDGKLEDAFNEQVTLELEAALTYRQLGIEMDVLGLPGLASWFRAQADEEVVHANKFIDHMTDRGSHPRIRAIPEISVKAGTVLEAFEASLAHEQKVSEAIRNLYRLSEQEGDIDSRPLLSWFIDEQLEEEASVGEIIDKVKLIDDDGTGLLALDAELGARESGGTED
ncbi:ferritin [Nesterenkonia aerolata]|uniref:Ferritin n=1 Tax=Nesterenkonia aerolata TaxID=3074079 RepID=A0ABU2DPE3_9MICC|nr:ferritin [Nesterenkonia sp. LY-0111]MDR8018379.1 ferritin [Nesterenkonia sp. LY-0111]